MKRILQIVILCFALVSLIPACQPPETIVKTVTVDDDGNPIVKDLDIYIGWAANDVVRAVKVSGSTLYLGGDFTSLYPYTGYGAFLDDSEDTIPDKNVIPYINNVVYTAVPDGKGGWYIGGTFTSVDGQTRNRLARINADGSLNAWNPDVTNGSVRVIKVSGDTVYVGGDFTQINGLVRSRIAAVNANSGKVIIGWDPVITGTVYAIETSSDTVYAAGYFTSVDATTISSLAAIDKQTGELMSKIPDLHFRDAGGNYATIFSMVLNNNMLYLGGTFTSMNNGTTYIRTRVAAISASTGAPTGWAPLCNGPVYSIAVSDNDIFIGGSFSLAGNIYRSNIAKIDSAGNVLSWDPNASSVVYSIDQITHQIFAGGAFATIGGLTQKDFFSVINKEDGKIYYKSVSY